jgi:hypothetical protein
LQNMDTVIISTMKKKRGIKTMKKKENVVRMLVRMFIYNKNVY